MRTAGEETLASVDLAASESADPMSVMGGLTRKQRVVKRALDLVVALVGLVAVGWLILPAWIAAFLDTRQNGFFTQWRVGKNGKLFRVIKLRTMRGVPGCETTITTSHDPRITRVGWFLRRTKIDELPQLLNVLMGQMSFVGPRPDVPGFADRLKGDDRIILTVRPGITGPATLVFRQEEELLAAQPDPERYNAEVIFPSKVRLNREYIRTYSVARDIGYMWQTVFGSRSSVLRVPVPAPPGASSAGMKTKMESAPDSRIYLSSPHMGGLEEPFVAEAFATNWIAPLGPHVDAFEREFCEVVGTRHAAALSSGTAALHLALQLADVQPRDEVLVSSLTFSASVNPIIYLGARPVFIDSERVSWNMDPALLEEALESRARAARLPRAVVVVHLYGQCADLDSIIALCERYRVTLIEDAAEALGATYKGKAPGTFGRAGIFSFNGNKIITTSGGGMLVSDDEVLISRARKLATQARDPAPHYQHSEIGYNYRLSNILAGIGRGQLRVLGERVEARRRNYRYYRDALGEFPGVEFMPEAPWGTHTRWLTCVTIDAEAFGTDREAVRLALEAENIEARPVWKPMHLQPVFAGFESVGGQVAEDLFDRGLCLPSGSNLTEADLERVASVVRRLARRSGRQVPIPGVF